MYRLWLIIGIMAACIAYVIYVAPIKYEKAVIVQLDVSDHYYSCIEGREEQWSVCK